MKHETKITERDIYKFVFSPESLELEKRNYLTANRERFKSEIEYCLALKKNSNFKESQEIVESVISRLNSNNIIELMSNSISHKAKDTKLKLAADSLTLSTKTHSFSFSDSTSDHVVKIVNTNSQSLLYFFSSELIPKARITFLPSETAYTIEDTSKPLEILDEENIERVIIEKL